MGIGMKKAGWPYAVADGLQEVAISWAAESITAAM